MVSPGSVEGEPAVQPLTEGRICKQLKESVRNNWECGSTGSLEVELGVKRLTGSITLCLYWTQQCGTRKQKPVEPIISSDSVSKLMPCCIYIYDLLHARVLLLTWRTNGFATVTLTCPMETAKQLQHNAIRQCLCPVQARCKGENWSVQSKLTVKRFNKM